MPILQGGTNVASGYARAQCRRTTVMESGADAGNHQGIAFTLKVTPWCW